MPRMPSRILAIDYGKARIGLAKSDVMGILAQSLTVLKRANDEKAIAEICAIAKAEDVSQFVVGLPKNMDGSLGDAARHCQEFAKQLAETSGLPVELYDERLTTVSAQRVLIEADMSRKRRRQVIDAVAATVLLQSYLDKNAKGKTDLFEE